MFLVVDSVSGGHVSPLCIFQYTKLGFGFSWFFLIRIPSWVNCSNFKEWSSLCEFMVPRVQPHMVLSHGEGWKGVCGETSPLLSLPAESSEPSPRSYLVSLFPYAPTCYFMHVRVGYTFHLFQARFAFRMLLHCVMCLCCVLAESCDSPLVALFQVHHRHTLQVKGKS